MTRDYSDFRKVCIVSDYENGIRDINKLCQKYELKKRWVYLILKESGYRIVVSESGLTRTPRDIVKVQRGQIKELLAQGKTNKEIAQELGVDYTFVRVTRKKFFPETLISSGNYKSKYYLKYKAEGRYQNNGYVKKKKGEN